MPKLWDDTIEAHRGAVRDAILETTAALVSKHGLRAVTMSQIAEHVGIGRATLYKYFPDVEKILVAWHERRVGDHVRQLAELGHRTGRALERLEAVLEAYARIQHEHHGNDLTSMLHRGEHVGRAHRHLQQLVQSLIGEAADAGDVRVDVPSEELSAYCLHALGAASSLASKASVRRLVAVTLAGLRRGQ